MNDRDCESCKKFSRVDPIESEGYCYAKRVWVDPDEGEDCKMHEFTLHSATKYKDGTPIMSEPEKVYCDTEFAKVQDDLIAEYDETLKTLKTHSETLEDHHERITINEGNIDSISADIEDLQRKVYQIYQFLSSVDPNFFAKIEEQIHSEPPKHNCSNFCGNCSHVSHTAPDELWRCILSGEIVDPDDSSCSMFEPPF